MKNKFRYILAALTAMIVSAPAFAQNINNANTQKSAKVNGDGTITLTLDTWINGYESNVYKESTVAVPLDIVLVLDVSGSMDENLTSTNYVKQSSKGYTAKNINNANYYYKDGDDYFRVKIEKDTKFGINNDMYYMYYTKGNDDFYLRNGTPTKNKNEAAYARGYDKTIWTGTLYITEKKTTKKLTALQSACATFVDNIAAKAAADKVEHRIAIVKFAGNNSNSVGNDHYGSYRYNYSQIVNNLTNSYSTVKTNIGKLDAAGATSVDYGLKHAETIVNAAVSAKATDEKRKNSKQVVVMFTDGEPNHGSGFVKDVANDAIKVSKSIKDSGATVYTVGVFDNPSKDVHTYMHYVSSNVTDATSMPSTSNITTPSGKYITATSAEELNAIFEAISDKIIIDSGGQEASTDLADKVSIVDIVTEQFTIPEVDGKYDIKLYEVKARDAKIKSGISRDSKNYCPLNVKECYDIVWETDGTLIKLGDKESVEVDTDNNTLDVKGVLARFVTKWVGVKEEWTNGSLTSSKLNDGAAMLRIEFKIIPNEEWDGGLAYTNSNESGIYIDGKAHTLYNVPDQVCLPANLTIRKSGMNPGESAIFEVTASGYDGGVTKKYTVAMTADEKGQFKDAVILKVDIAKNSQPGAEDPGYLTYTVRETTWGWAYESVPTGDGADESTHSITRTVSNNAESRVFVFEAKPKSESPKHAENSANNVFTK